MKQKKYVTRLFSWILAGLMLAGQTPILATSDFTPGETSEPETSRTEGDAGKKDISLQSEEVQVHAIRADEIDTVDLSKPQAGHSVLLLSVHASTSGRQGLYPAAKIASSLEDEQKQIVLPVVVLDVDTFWTGPKYAMDFLEMYESCTGVRPYTVVNPELRQRWDWDSWNSEDPIFDSVDSLMESLSIDQINEHLSKAGSHPDRVMIYRFYNPNTGEHFYTANPIEAGFLLDAGWNYESFGWAGVKEGQPVYRLYNSNDGGDHHYTTDRREADYLTSAGWSDEGVAFYSDLDETKPVYRVYNANARVNNHHFTLNASERDALVSIGWNDEGVAFQAGSTPVPSRFISHDSYFKDGIGYSARHTRLSGVQRVGGRPYLFDRDGAVCRAEGIADDGAGHKVFVQFDGTLAENGLISWQGGVYYFGKDCRMAVNTTVRIGNLNYRFGADGRWNNPIDVDIERKCNEVYAKVGKDPLALYLYVVNEFAYVTREEHINPPAGLTREQNYAQIGLGEKKGNCYCFAAALAALLRNAGVPVTTLKALSPTPAAVWDRMAG